MKHPHLHRIGCIAMLALAGGCTQDALDETALRASEAGTRAGIAPTGSPTSAMEAGAKVTERYYWVAKYQATLEQRQVAEKTARRAAPAVVAKAKAQGRTAPRYLAVRTRSDTRSKTRTSVMVWDTQSESIVGNSVYDLNETPRAEAHVKFETYSAPFVGSG